MPKIGMRNIKTAVSVFICIVILKLVNNPYPFYACIASVISMQSSVSGSFTAGKNRMIGTSVGAFIGLLFALIQPDNPFLCGLGIIIVIFTCNVLNKKKSATIACIVFIAISTNLKGVPPHIYSRDRLLETFLGIFVAVLVNYFVTPPNYINKLRKSCNELVDNVFISFGNLIRHDNEANLSKIKKQIQNLETSLNSYLSEIKSKKNKNVKVEKIKEILCISIKAYEHLVLINQINNECTLNGKNFYKFKELYNPQMKSSTYTSNDLNIVYNYHTEELLNILYDLKELDINSEIHKAS
ncbi:aromatic acid exporter family protein [Haloimpatiens sp. FM7330]|uniref:FUSC family protein n=1 Tax=Haloimpatiens sp. FM7330 TaxID=3298610 RepID=UPI003631F092